MVKKLLLVLALFLSACSQVTPPIATQEATTMEVPSEMQAPGVSSPTAEPCACDSVALPAGPLTLVALGDSLTQGDGDDTGLGYPGRLLEKLNAVRPDSTLSNLGQSGWSSDGLINGDQGIESQLDRAVAQLQDATSQGRAAVALVWIGSNDLWYLYEYGGDVNDEGDVQDAERYRSNMDMIVSRLRETGATVIVALLDDQSRRPVALKGEAFVGTSKDELDRMAVQVTRYNDSIRSIAAQYGAQTVDFYATDVFINPETLYYDGNHPNQAGYDVIAQKWWDVLSPWLK